MQNYLFVQKCCDLSESAELMFWQYTFKKNWENPGESGKIC